MPGGLSTNADVETERCSAQTQLPKDALACEQLCAQADA